MEITLKESILIRPTQETPKHRLSTTVLDQVMPIIFGRVLYFYKRPEKESSNFFEAGLMKDALSKVLVPFYPLAGRLTKGKNGQFDINCNGEGLLFTEAQTSCAMDEAVHTESNLKLTQLFPPIDYKKDRYKLFIIQVTRYKCGGVSIGVLSHHTVADGWTVGLFMKSWAETACGSPVSIPPVFDRALLDIGVPDSPTFRHAEYDPPPSMPTNPTRTPNSTVSTAIFELSAAQMNTLRENYSKKDDGSISSSIKYSRFEILAAHVWRCTCMARGLPSDQLSQVEIAIDGRSKVNPKIPSGYVGNVVFSSTPVASSGEIQSEALNQTVERIRGSLNLMDGKYLKSALAYLKQQPDLKAARRAAHFFSCPNLTVSNLSKLPTYEVDFGWGRPIFIRPVNAVTDGVVYILPTPENDGTVMVSVTFETNHLRLFKKFFYEVFLQSHGIIRSRF